MGREDALCRRRVGDGGRAQGRLGRVVRADYNRCRARLGQSDPRVHRSVCLLRLVVPSFSPANIKRNVDMSPVPTPSTPLHLPKPPPTPPAPPKKPPTPSPPKPKLRPPSSATLSTPAVPPPHRTFPIASDLVVDPPRKRRNQTFGKWQKTDGSKSGSRPRVSWKPRVRWGELSVRTLMKP